MPVILAIICLLPPLFSALRVSLSLYLSPFLAESREDLASDCLGTRVETNSSEADSLFHLESYEKNGDRFPIRKEESV